MNWWLTCMKKYVVSNGRARRKEYWMFALFNIIFVTVAGILDSLVGAINQNLNGWITALFSLAIILPTLAVTIRRLHDVGKSGWWIFISLLPIIGSIWLFVLTVTDSQPGDNQYGPNPKMNVAQIQS